MSDVREGHVGIVSEDAGGVVAWAKPEHAVRIVALLNQTGTGEWWVDDQPATDTARQWAETY